MIESCVKDTGNPTFANPESLLEAAERPDGGTDADQGRLDRCRSDSSSESPHQQTQIEGDRKNHDQTEKESLIVEDERFDDGKRLQAPPDQKLKHQKAARHRREQQKCGKKTGDHRPAKPPLETGKIIDSPEPLRLEAKTRTK